MFRSLLVILVAGTLLAGCTPRPVTVGDGEGTTATGSAAQPVPTHTITMGVRYELISLSSKALNNSTSDVQKRLFNASLSFMDGKGAIHPYLAEKLPRLNTDSWQVLPDGRMETTYRLRPNLSWHDGRALTADDFVLALSVYADPDSASSIPTPRTVYKKYWPRTRARLSSVGAPSTPTRDPCGSTISTHCRGTSWAR